MKVLLFTLIATLLMSSCYTTLRSHQMVMDSYNTKSAIINRFGLPTQKITEGDLEQWVYYFGSTTSKTTTGDALTNVYLHENSLSAYTNSVSSTTTHTNDRYVKFMLDRSGNVNSWNTNMDFTNKVRNKKKAYKEKDKLKDFKDTVIVSTPQVLDKPQKIKVVLEPIKSDKELTKQIALKLIKLGELEEANNLLASII